MLELVADESIALYILIVNDDKDINWRQKRKRKSKKIVLCISTSTNLSH